MKYAMMMAALAAAVGCGGGGGSSSGPASVGSQILDAGGDASASTAPTPPDGSGESTSSLDIRFTTEAGLGTSNSVAFLPNGAAIASSHRAAVGGVALRRTDALEATTAIAPGQGWAGLDGSSIAVDADGAAHVAAYEPQGQDLVYASNAGGAWTSVVLADAGDAGWRPVLRISPAGVRQIVFRVLDEAGVESLARLSDSGSGWIREEIVATDYPITSYAFAIDASGASHLAYTGMSNALVYGRQAAGGAWSFETVPTSDVPQEVALAADAMGYVQMVYREATDGRLYGISNDAGSWARSEIAEGARGAAVTFEEGASRLHLAYFREDGADLVYARRDVGGNWESFDLDTAGDVGRHAAIAARNGAAVVAYQDRTQGALKIAQIGASTSSVPSSYY